MAILKLSFTLLLAISGTFARDYFIRNDRDVLSSLNSVRPGDTIHLASETLYFLQNVELLRSGLPYAPITLTGGTGTKISSDNTALVVRGSHWKIQNIAFEKSPVGLIVHGNNNTIKGLTFQDIEEEALVLRGNGNAVKNNVFVGCNHGIVVSGVESNLFKNSITCTTTSVTLTPRSCCGQLEGNVFNGLLAVHSFENKVLKNIANSDVNIAGPRNEVRVNTINGRMDVTGCGNSFYGNTVRRSDFTTTCYNWDEGKNNFGGTEPSKVPIVHPTVVQAST